jgi:hypothetical protein
MIASSTAQAAGPILWVDDDQGEIGKVDVSTGQVTLVGNAGVVLTGIAFDPHGNLFGVSFNSFYSINSKTGVASAIGILGTGGTNALVFSNAGTSGYSVDPSTGAATFVTNWAGQGLGNANGEAFFLEAVGVPEPAGMTLLLGGVGLASLWALGRRSRFRRACNIQEYAT